nr:hypothetical protein [Candidatus Sigynarchaeota archaeon]
MVDKDHELVKNHATAAGSRMGLETLARATGSFHHDEPNSVAFFFLQDEMAPWSYHVIFIPRNENREVAGLEEASIRLSLREAWLVGLEEGSAGGFEIIPFWKMFKKLHPDR